MQQIEPTKAVAFEPSASAKAERTRAAILAAAEQHFARRGFVATRLEDVAAAVDLKRAALFYHFRDKQSLYDAMLADAFGSLTKRILEAFKAPDPIPLRVERACEAWVDTVVARPTLARLILRHAAEADDHATQGMFPAADELISLAWSLFEQGRANGDFKPVHDDPFQSASTVIGATVFYVAAMAPLLPNANFQPLKPDKVEAHKRDALRTVRLLLGISAPAPAPARKKAPSRTKKKSR